MASTGNRQTPTLIFGYGDFFRTFIPLFSEMAAPLTDLLKASGPDTRRLAWSVDCETST